jgi:hypothetical protein
MISNGQTSVGTAAIAIDGMHNQPTLLTIHNVDNTDAVYIGAQGVTIANGFVLGKEQTIQFTLNPLEQLWAVSGKTGHIISWLRQAL